MSVPLTRIGKGFRHLWHFNVNTRGVPEILCSFEPFCRLTRLMESNRVRRIMRVQSGVWLDYDLGAVTVLVIGLCIVALVAVVALSI